MSFLTQPITIASILGFGLKARQINNITVDVIITESTVDTLVITKQPVQQGATIADHAYKEPTAFSMQIRFNDNISRSLSKIYQDLLDLQNSRVPFSVITPKRVYSSMLLTRLGQTTDKATENVLSINVSFEEVIIVNIATTTVPRTRQRQPGRTGATQAAGKKSALLSGAQAFSPTIPGFQQ